MDYENWPSIYIDNNRNVFTNNLNIYKMCANFNKPLH